MTKFIEGDGSWAQYKDLPDLVEVDFHWSDFPPDKSYRERMGDVRNAGLEALKRAYEEKKRYVLFTHGSSTSRRGKTTARSVDRGLMRSSDSTPYVEKAKSIQHNSVFVAAIRKNLGASGVNPTSRIRGVGEG